MLDFFKMHFKYIHTTHLKQMLGNRLLKKPRFFKRGFDKNSRRIKRRFHPYLLLNFSMSHVIFKH